MKFPDGLRVYGDINYRHDGKCRHEDSEQIDFFSYLKVHWPQYYALAVHPKVEGRRTPQQAAKDKATGAMTKGASDIQIPGSPSFLCELKRLDHTQSHWEKGQREYLQAAQEIGAFTCVALGYKAALQALEEWDSIINANTSTNQSLTAQAMQPSSQKS